MSLETKNWVGTELAGRYQILSELGEGGMAMVYLAQDRQAGRKVVVKIPRQAMLDPEFAGRFQREAKSLVRLTHGNIVAILDFGSHAGRPFLVMDLLEGGSLRKRLARGPHTPAALRSWLPDIAAALDFCHANGCVHRDVKPDNILFDAGGRPYLSDFGIAKLLSQSPASNATVMTSTGMVLGTAQYMAPELILGKNYDGKADQYGLAATVYECLSGQTPYLGNSAAAVAVQQTTKEPGRLEKLNPAVPKKLADAIHRALAKNPAQRFADCAAFAQAVITALSRAGESAPPPSPPAPAADRPSVACPQCRKQFNVPPGAMGKKLRCPSCKASIPPLASLAETTLESLSGTDPAQARRPRRFGGKTIAFTAFAAGILVAVGAWASHQFGWLPIGITGAPPAPPAPAKFIHNSIGMKLAYVGPGKFTMGSPNSEQNQAIRDGAGEDVRQETQHEVEITHGFYMGVFAVTQAEYENVKGANPSSYRAGRAGGGQKDKDEKTYKDKDLYQKTPTEPPAIKPAEIGKDTRTYPVENVSWTDADAFCKALSAKEGKRYRLPTEAEWEYACRAGTKTAFHFGDTISTEQANYNGNLIFGAGKKGEHRGSPVGVGKFPANPFGLHDMHGNVWQWCEDWHEPDFYAKSPRTDPLNTKESSYGRVLRGGSWSENPERCRSARRHFSWVGTNSASIGFRVVLPSP